MKNLEIKIRVDSHTELDRHLKPYYHTTLCQKDTYFYTDNGRLKLREENDNEPYFILYQRPDKASDRFSEYIFYPVKDLIQFRKVFSGSLLEELVVSKTRLVYLIRNARIHLDTVKDLGTFMEIEIVINNQTESVLESTFIVIKKRYHSMNQ